MKKLFAIVTLLFTLSGCAGVGITPVNPYRPLSSASEVHSTDAKDLIKWAKETPSGQSYESRRLDWVNGYPNAQWSAGSWVGKPPPYGFGTGYGGYTPYYPRY